MIVMAMVNCVSGASPMHLKTRASITFKTRATMPFIAIFMFMFLFTQDVVLATQPPNIVLIVIDDLGKTITHPNMFLDFSYDSAV